MSRVVKLAVIPGDGIGPEVVAEAERVLDAVTETSDVVFDKTRFSLGAARFLETGDTLTDDDLAAISAHDGSLTAAIDSLIVNDGRSLVPYVPREPNVVEKQLAENDLLDPERPPKPWRRMLASIRFSSRPFR